MPQAVSLGGLPLGLAAIKLWTRKKFKGTNALKGKGAEGLKHSVNATRIPIEKKESNRVSPDLPARLVFTEPEIKILEHLVPATMYWVPTAVPAAWKATLASPPYATPIQEPFPKSPPASRPTPRPCWPWRALRIAHAIYRPHHICLCGGIGLGLSHLLPSLRRTVEKDLTRIARPHWTLTCGDDLFHAARGAARLAGAG